jgi:hypothetical protein
MGFLDINLDDATEPTAVPGDQEYKLRITDVREADDKNGQPYILPRFEIVGEPTAKEFTKFLRLPNDAQNEKQKNSTKWGLKVFFDAFEVDASNINTDEMIGQEGWAILGLEESDEWGEQNFIKKFIAPK